MAPQSTNKGIVRSGNSTIVRYSNALIRRAVSELVTSSLSNNDAVLIVDDESLFLDILSDFLKKRGFNNIDRAENGLDAIRKLISSKYGLIILGINMPLISGFGVLEFIKKSSIPTKAIVISGFYDEASVSAAMDLGAVAYLKKPTTFDQLASTLNGIMKKR